MVAIVILIVLGMQRREDLLLVSSFYGKGFYWQWQANICPLQIMSLSLFSPHSMSFPFILISLAPLIKGFFIFLDRKKIPPDSNSPSTAFPKANTVSPWCSMNVDDGADSSENSLPRSSDCHLTLARDSALVAAR